MTAFGYTRVSVVHDPTRVLSIEMQESEIRRLAEYHRDTDLVILSDVDISGKKDRGQRRAWDALLRAIESGEATAIYSYSLSRLSRRVRTLAEFFDLCAEKGVAIRLVRDEISTTSATGKLHAHILAAVAQFEADVASERVKDAFASKRANDPSWLGPGQPAYGLRPNEDPAVVIEAFRAAGSYDGAAKVLNTAGFPTRVPGRLWSGTVVRDVIKREAPGEALPNGRKGSPAGRRQFLLSGLLFCSICVNAGRSGLMSGTRDPRRGDVNYQCNRSRITAHPRGWVGEKKLLPMVVDEVYRAALQVKRKARGSAEDEARIAEIGAERTRVKAMFRKGRMEEDEFDVAMEELDREQAGLSAVTWVNSLKIPPPPDQDAPGRFNEYARRLLDRIVVDMSEKAHRGPSSWTPTLAFDWTDPSMRTADDEASVLRWPKD